ncbi:MAG TPA: SIMPL domain-containing protein, partial [Solirubrobacteraceae bacterium]|nr:SIMPL domain-containing protein [Solirubrobacteraceae bacterium]
MLRSTVSSIAATAVLVLALAPSAAGADAGAAVAAPTISVTGIGVVMLAPDVADLSIAVRSGAYSATTARAQANVRTARILAAIVRLGVDRGAIQTTGVTLERTSTTSRRHRPPR